MKTFIRILVLIIAFGLSGKAGAQGTTLTIFSEKGENFVVYVDGIQRNSTVADHVVIKGLNGPSFKLRIAFKDMSIHEINKSILNDPAGVLFYSLKAGKKKGEYILEKTSSDVFPTQEAGKEATPAPSPKKESKQTKAKTEASTKKESKQTKAKTEASTKKEGKQTKAKAEASTKKESKQTKTKAESTAKKSGVKCDNPMTEGDFQSSTIAVSSAPFDGIRLTQAKNLVETHCLYSRQIAELLHILNTEPSRLTLAKDAYKHCYDPENYNDVREALNSKKSKEDLDHYIKSVK
jgi:hypothetical protein